MLLSAGATSSSAVYIIGLLQQLDALLMVRQSFTCMHLPLCTCAAERALHLQSVAFTEEPKPYDKLCQRVSGAEPDFQPCVSFLTSILKQSARESTPKCNCEVLPGQMSLLQKNLLHLHSSQTTCCLLFSTYRTVGLHLRETGQTSANRRLT